MTRETFAVTGYWVALLTPADDLRDHAATRHPGSSYAGPSLRAGGLRRADAPLSGEDAGFATAAEQAAWEVGAASPAGPFDVEYHDGLHVAWRTLARGCETLESATAAAVELVTMPRCCARRSRVRTQRKHRLVGRTWITVEPVTLAEFERAEVRAQAGEVGLPLAA